jgi:predicted RNA methylase
LLPGKDGAVMDLGLVKLGCGTTILGIGLALVEALAVTVVEGDITY